MEKSKSNYTRWKYAFIKKTKYFTNNKWPTYFTKTKEYFIWDLDGKKYKDFSYMGVGTNLLGYSNNLIDKKIKNVIDKGNISTLNCVEEVFLTEKLLNIHKWAGMAKYAKTGGEAATIALRIDRSFNNKEVSFVDTMVGMIGTYQHNYLKRVFKKPII